MLLNKIIQLFVKLFLVLSLTISIVWGQEEPEPDTQQNQQDIQSQDGEFSESSENQDNESSESSNPTPVADEGELLLSNILINNFENADRWFGAMSIDSGLIQVEKRKGAPLEIREANPDISKYVLGAKINFFKRGFGEASLEPPAPIFIPGYTKKLSVWAYGRGSKHKLSAIVRDFKGRIFKFSFGQLSFYGWKKLETSIPSDPSWPFFSQVDSTRKTFYKTHGVTFIAFLIEFDPKESIGRFYTYLDNLEAESNVSLYVKELEMAQIPEDERLDPIDDW